MIAAQKCFAKRIFCVMTLSTLFVREFWYSSRSNVKHWTSFKNLVSNWHLYLKKNSQMFFLVKKSEHVNCIQIKIKFIKINKKSANMWKDSTIIRMPINQKQKSRHKSIFNEFKGLQVYVRESLPSEYMLHIDYGKRK